MSLDITAPKVIKLIFYFCILLAGVGFVLGQKIVQTPENEKYLKFLYTTDNGLPQNSPTSMVQTPDGYLWIGTFGGLARFDGLKFTIFTTTNTPQLSSNRIVSLAADQDGTLWIGSEEGDIVSFRNGGFELLWKSQGPPRDGIINSILTDGNGNLILGTSLGLKVFILKTKQFTDYGKNELFKKNTVTEDAIRITEQSMDEDGTIWLATNGGIISYKDGKFTNYNIFDGLPTNIIYSVKPNPKGGLWVLTPNELGKFENGKYTTIYKNQPNEPTSSKLLLNQENHLFFTILNTLYEFDENGNLVNRLDLSDVKKSSIRSIFSNREGQIFLGTDNGLIQLKKRYIRTFASYLNSNADPTYTVIEDAEKNVWVSTDYKFLKWKDGKFEPVWLDKLGFEWQITALGNDADGNLIIPTKLGIYKYQNSKFNQIFDQPVTLGNTSIFTDKQNRIWLGSIDKGIAIIENGQLKLYSTKDGLVNNTVVFITQDRSGAIWIGTKGGMSRFENGKFKNWTMEDGLSNNYVRDIYEDQDGTIWIGTYGGGINRFLDGKFTKISSENGLPEEIASRILVDDTDNFWVMGNQGIYSVSGYFFNLFAVVNIKMFYCFF